MKVQRIGGWGGPIHVFPDEPFAKPVAGPFATEAAGRLWILETLEASLKPDKLETWRKVAEQLPAPTDFGLELALIGFILHGVPYENLLRYIPKPLHPRGADRRQHFDRRELAAGER